MTCDTIQCVAHDVWTSYGKARDGVVDIWRPMNPGDSGDCEDFALTTGVRLLDLGYSPSDLEILVTRTWDGQCHAVLRVKNKIVDNGRVRNLSSIVVLNSVPLTDALQGLRRGCPQEESGR